jgi:hypothetical protein
MAGRASWLDARHGSLLEMAWLVLFGMPWFAVFVMAPLAVVVMRWLVDSSWPGSSGYLSRHSACLGGPNEPGNDGKRGDIPPITH